MPRALNSSIHGAKGSFAGTSAKTPWAGGGTYAAPSYVFRRKTAICARVTGEETQYAPPPQPAAMPSTAIHSISLAAKLPQETSVKIWPRAWGGWKLAPFAARTRKTAICDRVTGLAAQ